MNDTHLSRWRSEHPGSKRIVGIVAASCPEPDGYWPAMAAVHLVPELGPVVFPVRKQSFKLDTGVTPIRLDATTPVTRPVVLGEQDHFEVRCLHCRTTYTVPADELQPLIEEHRRTGRRPNYPLGR